MRRAQPLPQQPRPGFLQRLRAARINRTAGRIEQKFSATPIGRNVNRFGQVTNRFGQRQIVAHKHPAINRFARAVYPQIPQQKSVANAAGKRAVGRPAGVYKHGMPAKQYYKVVRKQIRQQKFQYQQNLQQQLAMQQQAEQPQIQQQVMQRPGIFRRPNIPFRPPQRQFQPQPNRQQFSQMGNQAGNGSPYTPIPLEKVPQNYPGTPYYEEVDLMSGRRILRQRIPSERWAQD